MSVELKGSRHVAVAIPNVRVSRGIAVSPSWQRPQPQQMDFAQYLQSQLQCPPAGRLTRSWIFVATSIRAVCTVGP
jgi:hypothetical protein